MASTALLQDPPVAVEIKKRSFLKLPVEIDLDRLLADYRSIPAEAWATSRWDTHCSSDMLLLRGGRQGGPEDFTTDDVSDQEILSSLPYFSSLISADGPFGQPSFAFIFRMRPMGVSRAHIDDDPAWKKPFRIHIPITTNPDAVLLSDTNAKHLEPGEVWSFDNQAMHGVVNGDSVRTHLIIDVPRNPKLDALLSQAEWDPGVEDAANWQKTLMPEDAPPLVDALSEPLSVAEKRELDLNPEGFAGRVVGFAKGVGLLRRLGLLRSPASIGDVVYSVNGVEVCEVARTATSYIGVRHKAGDRIVLGLIRDGQRIERSTTLKSDNYLGLAKLRKGWQKLKSLRGKTRSTAY
jgi:hypothetical protein